MESSVNHQQLQDNLQGTLLSPHPPQYSALARPELYLLRWGLASREGRVNPQLFFQFLSQKSQKAKMEKGWAL
jgi:hypothetical protein